MIIGIGIDMIETERVAKKISGDIGFREYVFSSSEIEYCEARTNKAEHYAARFAAKEALLKAFGTGLLGGLNLNEIIITGDESGKPSLQFTGETAEKISLKGELIYHVTMSHLKSIACAMVVIEKSKKYE